MITEITIKNESIENTYLLTKHMINELYVNSHISCDIINTVGSDIFNFNTFGMPIPNSIGYNVIYIVENNTIRDLNKL